MTLFASCNKEKEYRNDFVGTYLFTTQVSSWDDFSGSSSYTKVDTGNIKLFSGHEGNQDDISHKIGIILDHQGNLSTNENSCYEGLKYGAYDYLHPTINEVGEMSYPEYECYAWGYSSNFSGSIVDGELNATYGYSSSTHGSSFLLSGTRIE